MESSLVVVDDTEAHESLLREAGRIAADTESSLVLLSWITKEEVENNLDTLRSMGDVEHTTYDDDLALDVATQSARDLAVAALADDGQSVEYEVVSVVVEDDDDVADEVLRVAREEGCEHVYVVGRERSPTGKALFGDVAQRVVLNFDGFVTVATE